MRDQEGLGYRALKYLVSRIETILLPSEKGELLMQANTLSLITTPPYNRKVLDEIVDVFTKASGVEVVNDNSLSDVEVMENFVAGYYEHFGDHIKERLKRDQLDFLSHPVWDKKVVGTLSLVEYQHLLDDLFQVYSLEKEGTTNWKDFLEHTYKQLGLKGKRSAQREGGGEYTLLLSTNGKEEEVAVSKSIFDIVNVEHRIRWYQLP